MKLYLASQFMRWPEIEGYAKELCSLGHEITSRWHNGSHTVDETTNWDRARLAMEDIDDLYKADGIVVFTQEPDKEPGKGGHHVEFGLALAWLKILFVVGPRLNVFHYLPTVHQFNSLKELEEAIGIDQTRSLN